MTTVEQPAKEISSTEEPPRLMKTGEVPLPPETLAAFGGDELRARVFYEKYALRDVSGRQIERTPSQMWHRVASELASVEKEEGSRREWASKFYWLLEDFRFVPGGRILFGAGQPRNATLLNCLNGDTQVLVRDSVEWHRQTLGHNNSSVAETIQIAASVGKVRVRDIVGKPVEMLTLDGWKSVI